MEIMSGTTTTVAAEQNTISTASVGMSDIEAKRRAVLASMRKRRAASRSRSASQSPLVAAASPVPIVSTVSLPTLEDAIVDLRSIGYSFDMILEKSGISREFLEKCYRRWNYPLPIRPVVQVTPQMTPVLPQRPMHIDHQKKQHSSSSSAPAPYKKPLYANKVYRPDGDRPDWLKSLVIDLESSDEESEDEDIEDSDTIGTIIADKEVSEANKENEGSTSGDEDSYVPEMGDMRNIARQRTNSSTSATSIFGQPDGCDDFDDDYDPEDLPQKKRKLSNELKFGHMTMDDVLSKKEALEKKMKDIGEQVTINDEKWNQIEASIQVSMNLLKEKELRVTTYRNMIYSLESEIQQENNNISSLMHEKNSLPDSRAEMAKCLVEMENLENQEEKLRETERKRVELRSKLLKQMKEKKKKKEQQNRTKLQQQQQQQQSDTSQLRPGEADFQQLPFSPTTETLTTKQETPAVQKAMEVNNDVPDKQVYDETIHKIPKAQASHFTPYKSLGLTHKATNRSDDNNMALCPLELVNGACTDKQCQFKHL